VDLFDEGVTESCLHLRECAFIQKILNESGDFLNIPGGREGGLYFLSSIERFVDPEFVPTSEDILRARTKTTGIHETRFRYENRDVSLVDVGGQKSERRKWIPAFAGTLVAAVFIVSISDYDSLLEEDRATSRLTDAIELFKALQDCPYLNDVPFVLLLNKIDLFKQKIVQTPLREVFADYPADVELFDELKAGVDYISGLFKLPAPFPEPFIYTSNLLAADSCLEIWKKIWTEVVQTNAPDAIPPP